MKPLKHVVILTLLILFHQTLSAQVSKDAAVQIDVTIGTSPHTLVLHLPSDPNAIWYDVYRRNLGSSNWGTSIMHLTGISRQFADTTVIIGNTYEYRVLKAYQIPSSGALSGQYLYKITFVTAQGETQGGSTSASLIPAAGEISLTSIPKGISGVIKRKIYRTTSGGADGTQKLVATIADNVTTTYTDNIADAALGAAVPLVNTAMTPPAALNGAAGAAGPPNGTYLYKVTFVTKAGETSGGSTSAQVVLSHQQANLTAIAKGPTGTTARNIYRTSGTGSDGTQKLVGTLSGNVTTTFTDSIADGSLGVPVPTINTAYAAPAAPVADYILFPAYGYTESGIEKPAVNDRGKLILLIDKTFSDSLKTELSRLEQDLWNDGWHVIRHDVGRNDKVPDVKALIVNDYTKDPNNTKALFIFGHVPVPYSGFLNPDGHPNHFGAWPADVYYGEINSGDWTDDQTEADSNSVRYYGAVIDTNSILKLNLNLTGDGKFDYAIIPDSILLEIGRVDLADMTWFSKSEKDLLRQYLDKDHAFRTGSLTAPKRALLEDSFGFAGGEAFASSGWRNLAPLVGADSIHEVIGNTDSARTYQWLPLLANNAYLWIYGCGGGWPNGAGGAGSTGQFANQSVKGIFTMLFGSYFGDWNVPNNFLRAPLCTDYGLSCAWSGRPYWDFFPMGLGEPIGYCAKLTQNNGGDFVFNYAAGGVHIALMGDPTLVMNPYVPPVGLSVTANASRNNALLSWQPSSDKNILGYNIYRSNRTDGTYNLITPSPVTSTSYTDMSPLVDTNAYMVRAVKLETTPSGSYYNLSAGTRSFIAGMIKNGVISGNQAEDNLQIMRTTGGVEIILHKSYASYAKLEIYDASGKVIRTLDNRTLSEGTYRYDWQTSSVASGVYFIRATGMREPLMAKVLVVQ